MVVNDVIRVEECEFEASNQSVRLMGVSLFRWLVIFSTSKRHVAVSYLQLFSVYICL